MNLQKPSMQGPSRRNRTKHNGVGRPRGTGAQRVFDKLRERILALELSPHADIDELDLVREFEISRTPVREALIRLASEGLVELLPNKGARVASLNANEVPQILEALELAQRVVTRWAAERRSEQHLLEISEKCREFSRAALARDFTQMSDANRSFHLAIGRACGNSYTKNWYEGLLNASMRLARLAFEQAPLEGQAYREYYAEVDREHRETLDAIEKRDLDRAERLAREHVALFRERIQKYLSQSRAGDIDLT